MIKEDKKSVDIKEFDKHVTISLPNGSWIEYDYDTGDIMGWDVRKRKNFTSLMSTEELE